jgi:hypothetical protein
MQLRDWITSTGISVQSFAAKLNVQRAMIYRYFTGTIPRATTMRRIEMLTRGAVKAADFYANAWMFRKAETTWKGTPEPEVISDKAA